MDIAHIKMLHVYLAPLELTSSKKKTFDSIPNNNLADF